MTTWLLGRLWTGQGAAQWGLRLVMLAVLALAGVVMLTLASVPAVLDAQERTLGWTFVPEDPNAQAVAGVDTDWVSVDTHIAHLDSQRVTVIVAGVTGRGVPPPPGLDTWPAPGEAILSPALTDLAMRTGIGPNQFGEAAGVLGEAALRGPADLLVVRGARPDQVDTVAIPLTALAVGHLPRSPVNNMLTVVLSLAVAGAIVPPLVLAATVLQANELTVRRRLSLLSLAGVSRRVVQSVMIAESALLALAGWLLGVGVFWLARPLLAALPTWEVNPFARDLVPPGWAYGLAAIPSLVVLVWSVFASRTWTRAGSPRDQSMVAAPRLLLLLAAGLLAWVLAAVPNGAGAGAAMGLGGLAVLLLSQPVLRGLGRLLRLSDTAAGHLAGAYLATTSGPLGRQLAPSVLACFVAAAFLTLNPSAVASAQAGVITQGPGHALVRVGAADIETSHRLVDRLEQVEGVTAAAAVVNGDLPPREPGPPTTVWFGTCDQVVDASGLPGALCAGDDTMWVTGAARDSLLSGSAEVQVPHGRTPEPMNGVPDENQPVSLTLTADPDRLGELATPPASWDLPGLLVDPGRAGVDLSWFRPSVIMLAVQDNALAEVSRVVAEEVPTATITTRDTGLWAFAGQMERYYSQLLTGALAVLIIGAVGAVVLAVSHQVERLRSHAVLHASGVPISSIRRGIALMLVIPLLAMALLATVVGLTVGFWGVGADLSYLGDVLTGLLPLGAGVAITCAVVWTAAWWLGPRIGPEQLRAE